MNGDGANSGGGERKGGGRCMEGRESDINRILSRYRPIAPKSVVGGSGTSGGGSAVLSEKRTKRKYVRVCKEKQRRIVTLQLLPEKADLKAEITQFSVGSGSGDSYGSDLRVVEYNNNDNNNNDNNFDNIWYSATEFVAGGGSRVTESWVTVESVMVDERVTEDNLLISDNIVWRQFEGESCPGFLAKAESGRVEWVNEAYMKMVGCNEFDVRSGSVKTVVWFEVKEEVAKLISRVRSAFSCWVKVQYNSEEDGRRGVSIVLPCDVWRMQRGGFAWRLNMKAALCLGIAVNSDGCIRPSS